MKSLRRPLALVLLAVFAAGGSAVPTLHRIQHALETAHQVAALDAAAAGHVHTGRTVITQPLPDAPDDGLACVLCHGVAAHVLVPSGWVHGLALVSFHALEDGASARSALAALPLARGPPSARS